MSCYAVQDETDPVPEGVVGDVRTEVAQDEWGDEPPDARPDEGRDEVPGVA